MRRLRKSFVEGMRKTRGLASVGAVSNGDGETRSHMTSRARRYANSNVKQWQDEAWFSTGMKIDSEEEELDLLRNGLR